MGLIIFAGPRRKPLGVVVGAAEVTAMDGDGGFRGMAAPRGGRAPSRWGHGGDFSGRGRSLNSFCVTKYSLIHWAL